MFLLHSYKSNGANNTENIVWNDSQIKGISNGYELKEKGGPLWAATQVTINLFGDSSVKGTIYKTYSIFGCF